MEHSIIWSNLYILKPITKNLNHLDHIKWHKRWLFGRQIQDVVASKETKKVFQKVFYSFLQILTKVSGRSGNRSSKHSNIYVKFIIYDNQNTEQAFASQKNRFKIFLLMPLPPRFLTSLPRQMEISQPPPPPSPQKKLGKTWINWPKWAFLVSIIEKKNDTRYLLKSVLWILSIV